MMRMGGKPEAEGIQGGLEPQAEPQDDEATEEASPEEQKLFETVVDNALRVIYSPQSRAAVLKSLGASSNFVMNLANVTAHIVVRVESSAKQSGTEIPGDILMKAGEEIMRDLANLAQEVGIHTYTPDELERAGLVAIDQYRQLGTKAGLVDPNALKSQFMAAQQAGQQQGGGAPAVEDDEQSEPVPDDEEEEGEA